LRDTNHAALNAARNELAAYINKEAKKCEDILFDYMIDSQRKPSLTNATRLSPARIEVVDVVSLLQSPIQEDCPLARKLFTKTIESLGEGKITGGTPLPNLEETSRTILGVLRISTPDMPVTSETVRDILVSTGLINASHLCVEHYELSESSTERKKVEYPPAAHKVFSHFHPIEGVERLLWHRFADGVGTAQMKAVIEPTDLSQQNVLISKVTIGTVEAICIEGIIVGMHPVQQGEQTGGPKGKIRTKAAEALGNTSTRARSKNTRSDT
jgi:hypothetical protein